MEFKKLTLWTTKEDEILKLNFHSKPFNSHDNTRYPTLQSLLKEQGFERTIKAVSRRCYRIGLKTITINEEEIEVTCEKCNTKYNKRKRYFERDTKHICTKCQKINGGYTSRERYLEYQKTYGDKK